MRILILVACVFLWGSPIVAQSQDKDLAFVLEVLEKDYAGWETKTAGERRAAFDAEVELARERIAERPDARMWAYSALLEWFQDDHLTVRSKIVSPSNPWPVEDAANERLMRPDPGPDFAFERLSDETVMLRVPSFSTEYAEQFEALLSTHHDTIISTPNLLIDLRRNSGGSDAMYQRLMSYLYTRPIYSIGVELRASERNLAHLRGLLEESGGEGDVAAIVRLVIEQAAGSDSDWVSLYERDFTISTYPQVYTYPKRVVVLIEGAGSSGDQFAIDARASRKVTLMGWPSAGVIDYSNVITATAPSGNFMLAWPMTRSMRLPDESFDNVGVQPDVQFNEDIEDEIGAAQTWLEAQPH